jgi:Kef-type K+ transport system membrane component KefB
MLKLSTAAKSSGSSYLNKTWTIIILAVALVYAALTLVLGNPLEKRGVNKKQMDAAFAVVVISLCFVGMALSKDKNASLEVEIEKLLREGS